MSEGTAASTTSSATKWRPLSARERRVLGVLIEKAKTTPDQYPMTLNGLCSGCNQKSNRFPQMELTPDDVEETLERLRGMGAVSEVQGSGRVNKYRHLAYEWLGVEKVELSIMAELLLRGAQTEGELRGRAARMDTIADLGALRALLDSLAAKKLVVSVTPEGRGHVITHNLYEPRELEKIRAEHRGGATTPVPPAGGGTSYRAESSTTASAQSAAATAPPGAHSSQVQLDSMRSQFETLRDEVRQLRSDLEDVRAAAERAESEVRQLKELIG